MADNRAIAEVPAYGVRIVLSGALALVAAGGVLGAMPGTQLGWQTLAVIGLAVGGLAAVGIPRPGSRVAWTVPRVGMAAALVVLVAGLAVGGDGADAARISFVILAATSMTETAAGPAAAAPTTAGLVQVGMLTVGAVAAISGVQASNLALTEANVPLQLGAIAIFLVRVGQRLLPGGAPVWLMISAVALAVDAGLVAHVVFEVGRQRYATAGLVPPWLVFAVNHVTTVGVGATALLGTIAALYGKAGQWRRTDRVAAACLVLALVGATTGLAAGAAAAETLAAAALSASVLAAVLVAGWRIWLR